MQRQQEQLSRHGGNGKGLRSVVGALLLLLGSACAGPGPGSISFGSGEADSTGSKNDKTDTSATSSSKDKSTTGPTDKIFGTEAFTAGQPQDGPAKGKDQHTQINAQKDPSGQDCMTCHGSTFGFGGTLYSDSNGSAPVAGAEIRVVNPDGSKFGSTFSDADGNFWFESTGAALQAGSHVGVRNGSAEMTMSQAIGGTNAAGCNSSACHNATFRVNLH
jgi:hypothetical protein